MTQDEKQNSCEQCHPKTYEQLSKEALEKLERIALAKKYAGKRYQIYRPPWEHWRKG